MYTTDNQKRKLNFQRQTKRLSHVGTHQDITIHLSKIDEDIKLTKQLFKQSIADKNSSGLQKYGDKLITLLADKTAIKINDLHKQYSQPPDILLSQLTKNYTKEAYNIFHIIDRFKNMYGNTTN